MKLIIAFTLHLLAYQSAIAQHKLFYLQFPNNVYFIPKTESTALTGTSSLFNEPQSGFLILESDDTIKNLLVQYDCLKETITAYDISVSQSKRENYELSIQKVKYLNTEHTVLFNPTNAGFQSDDEKKRITGLVELNYYSPSSDFILGRYYVAYLERANYNPVFDSGSKEDKLSIRSNLYLFYKGYYYLLPKDKSQLKEVLHTKLNLTTKNVKLTDDEKLIEFLEAHLN